MKRIVMIVFVGCLILTGCQDTSTVADRAAEYITGEYGVAQAEVPPKVILDCDMTYLGDDAMCMCLLVQADSLGLIDLLGVTITGGNNFVAYGANAALNQLEQIVREDIQVFMGTDIPINGIRDLEKQAEIVGQIDRWGAMYHFDEYVEPAKYHDLGSLYERKWGYSQTDPQEQTSTSFMIEQVNTYKGEVTIISVGAATNIALACQQDSSFAANTAGIIYMGTIIEGYGTFTPYADFNCFYDAESFDICFNSAFPSQTVISHDAAKTAVLNKAVYDLMDAKDDTPVSKFWIENEYSLYRRDINYKRSCPDAIAAIVFLNPDVIQEDRMLSLEINTDVNSPEYGHVTSWENGNVKVVMAVDTGLYWDFATDLICHMESEFENNYWYYVEANGLIKNQSPSKN